MLPFEFTIEGPPVTHQAADKARLKAWRERVKEAAAERWPQNEAPTSEPVQLVITYFHERATVRIDNDNLTKPIQDALTGIVFVNDRQVTDIKVRKTNLDGSFRVRGMSLVLAEAFSRGTEFLHIRIARQPDHSELLA
jgi:Holliday junction resolvase RusA-like endonuclease